MVFQVQGLAQLAITFCGNKSRAFCLTENDYKNEKDHIGIKIVWSQ